MLNLACMCFVQVTVCVCINVSCECKHASVYMPLKAVEHIPVHMIPAMCSIKCAKEAPLDVIKFTVPTQLLYLAISCTASAAFVS